MNLQRELGIPLLKMAIVYNRLVEITNEETELLDVLGAAIEKLGAAITEIEACRQVSDEREQPESVNFRKHSLDS